MRFTFQKKSLITIGITILIILFFIISFSIFFTKQIKTLQIPHFSLHSPGYLGSVSLDLSNKQGGDIYVTPPQPIPHLLGEMLDPNMFTAKSMVAVDHETGNILFEKNSEEIRPTASVVKLLSALVILENNIDFDLSYPVIRDPMADSHMYYGDRYRASDLWIAALTASSNKAIYTLADGTGLSREEFVFKMNEKAKNIGMTNSTFVEPSGLDARNLSTSRDLVKLLANALEYQKILEPLITEQHTITTLESKKNHSFYNTNWLLLGWISNSFEEFYGGKTGFIPESGYNFTMRVGDENGHLVDIVVLGAASHEARFTEARDLATWIYKNYEWR